MFNQGTQAGLVLCVSHKDTSLRPGGQGCVKTHVRSMDIRNSSLQKVCGMRWALGHSGLELRIFMLVHAELPWKGNGQLFFPSFTGRKSHDQCNWTLLFYFLLENLINLLQ